MTNKEGTAESTAKLSVEPAKKDKAPKFSSELKSQKAKEGGDVKFKCKVEYQFAEYVFIIFCVR